MPCLTVRHRAHVLACVCVSAASSVNRHAPSGAPRSSQRCRCAARWLRPFSSYSARALSVPPSRSAAGTSAATRPKAARSPLSTSASACPVRLQHVDADVLILERSLAPPIPRSRSLRLQQRRLSCAPTPVACSFRLLARRQRLLQRAPGTPILPAPPQLVRTLPAAATSGPSARRSAVRPLPPLFSACARAPTPCC